VKAMQISMNADVNVSVNEKDTLNTVKMYESSLFHTLTGNTIRPGGFKITKRAMELCGYSKDARLLDIGCGRGATVEYLEQYSIICTGIDSSALLIEEGLNRNKHLELILGNAESLPIEDECMDGVIAECSFSLMRDKEKVLDEINRVLKNEGKFILTDMYLKSAEKNELPKGAKVDSCILNAFVLEDLNALITKKGFRILHFEDHTRALKELMANIIMEHGTLESFFQLVGRNTCGCSLTCSDWKKLNLGYFLLIAQKETEDMLY
jgi:arsenite methyltransferase